MNILFAPSESRAQDFLKRNRFGLDDRTQIFIDHNRLAGRRFFDEDTLYILDGVSHRTLEIISNSTRLTGTTPRVISVDER